MKISLGAYVSTILLLVSALPTLGVAATTTVIVKKGSTTVCTLTYTNLAGNCGNKLKIENSGGGTARVIVSDTFGDQVKLTNTKIVATQPISGYTLFIQTTNLATPPSGEEVWYKTSAKGTASTPARFYIQTLVTDSNGTTYSAVQSLAQKGPTFQPQIPAQQVSEEIAGSRNITIALKIAQLNQNEYIDLASNFIQIQNQDQPDDELPPAISRDLSSSSSAIMLEAIIKGSSREACLGIHSAQSGCYGVYIK